MKRILAVIFTVAMMTAFTGCKGDSVEDAKEKAEDAIEEAKELIK